MRGRSILCKRSNEDEDENDEASIPSVVREMEVRPDARFGKHQQFSIWQESALRRHYKRAIWP